MNNKLLVEVSELMKKECDSILNAKTGEEMYESIDGILELLPLMLKSTYAVEKKPIDISIDSIKKKEHKEDGGPGSGNHNHSGRPGKIGGSSSEYSTNLQNEKNEILSEDVSMQALFLYKRGYLSKNDAVKAMEDETAPEKIEEYYKLLEKNGDPTPTKPVSKQVDAELAERVNAGEFHGYMEGREQYIKDWTGAGEQEAKKMNYELQTWFSGSWSRADTATLDRYIEKDHAYEGTIYRGLHFGKQDDYDKFMKQIDDNGGIIKMNGNSSWSSNEGTARGFAHTVDPDQNSVVIVCTKNRTSAPVSHISSQGEDEVLAHSKAKWTVLHKESTDLGDGIKNTMLYVIESGEYDD